MEKYMKIIDYCILTSETRTDLSSQIFNLLKDNWEPIGGVAIEMFPSGESRFYQAMIKVINKS